MSITHVCGLRYQLTPSVTSRCVPARAPPEVGVSGGEPLTTRVAYEVMHYMIEHDIPGQVAKKSELVERRLNSLHDRFPAVQSVRGKGLMWAVQFSSDIGERITSAALANGLILNNVRPNAVRIVPPLTVTEEELEQGLAILEHVIAEDAGTAVK